MQQKLAQLLLLQLAECSLKPFFYSKQKEVRTNAQIFSISWNDTQGWIYNCWFYNLKGCGKMKNIKFLKRDFFFFISAKFCWHKLAIFLGITSYLPYAATNCKGWKWTDRHKIWLLWITRLWFIWNTITGCRWLDDMNMAIIILCFDEKIARPSVIVVFHFSFICETLGN